MYAIIHAGGKQYRVAKGDQIKIEKISGNPGDTVRIHDVLLVADGEKVKVGTPVLDGASVSGTILEQGKRAKVINFKFRRRKDSRKTIGHRQQFTAVQITEIQA